MNVGPKKNAVKNSSAKKVTVKIEKPVEPVKEASVAALAYQYWLEEGASGDDLSRWLRAEQQIRLRNHKA